MIDIKSDRLLSPWEAARLRPNGRGGKPTHVATVYRWISNGARGTKLESARIGGSLYISNEPIQRFADRLTIGPDIVAKPPTKSSTASRRRSAERAERTLDWIGI